MHTPCLTRHCERGHSTTPILVFLGIVVLSVLFFFALTLPRQLEQRRRAAADMARAATAQAEAAAREHAAGGTAADATTGMEKSAADPSATADPSSSKAGPDPGSTTAAVPSRFASPRQFMQSLAAGLLTGDMAEAEALLGAETLTGDKADFFRSVFGAAGLRPAAAAPLREIGDAAEYYRWALRLEAGPEKPGDGGLSDTGSSVQPALPPGGEGAADATDTIDRLELEVDVTRDPARGWRAAAVHFPEPLRLAVATRLGAASVPASVAAAAEDQQDPLKIAGQFLRAVLKQDYAGARGITDTEAVTREKVAGLCILFEEGAYSIADERPLSATAAGSTAAWVIVKVKSGQNGEESDFGLELRRLDSGDWQVAGVNFSKMLAGYAAHAGAEDGVAYSPIVKNPEGGESLVVYFDFNEAGLVPRARRQLEIVANLLRDDPRRKLRLSGHADAIGPDSYNRRLSAARALAVKDALAELGVSAHQIVTEGLGTLRPLDPNTKPDGSDNPEGRSRNRRTEIYLDF